LLAARKETRTNVIVIETAYDQHVPSYESWWDVPIAEVSERESVRTAHENYQNARKKERFFF
jgi:3D-(3,5/4)-trihydroxycyclohexane-1,2-dione acylhydrolase (decyclizing)